MHRRFLLIAEDSAEALNPDCLRSLMRPSCLVHLLLDCRSEGAVYVSAVNMRFREPASCAVRAPGADRKVEMCKVFIFGGRCTLVHSVAFH